MIRRIISSIPNTITCLNLLSGCMAIYFSFNLDAEIGTSGLTGRYWCYIMLGAAAIFDFCDGLASRLLDAYSEIGKELDSLSDLVSFGVAPAMLILNIMLANTTEVWPAFAALFIPAMGGLRLARFNVKDAGDTTFRGLPIPANAIFWIGFSDWIYQYTYPGDITVWVVIVLISLAMVSRIKMFSLKFKNLKLDENFRRYVIIMAAIAFVIFYGIVGLAWVIVLYIFISMLSRNR